MSKEAQEEAMEGITNNSNSSATNDHLQAMVKGKRTKRMRLLHALVPAAPATSSPASSSCEQSESTTTEEEEDMANCLILLAQGRTQEPWLEEEGGAGSGEAGEKLSIIRPVEAAAATEGKVGVYAYECKTCNKCFPSFQALGGHRASHKKPKMLQAAAAMAAEEKRAVDREDNILQMSIVSYSNTNILPNNGSCRTISPTCNNNINSSNSASNNKARVHECSICGSEFSSGQALGGHMRRHRAPAPAPAPEAAQEAKKKRSILALDLNLPAPMEDGDFPRSPSFAFSGKRPLIFSASTLVDCQY